MRTLLFLIAGLAGLTAISIGAPPPDYTAPSGSTRSVDDTTYINANNMLMFVTNHGNFGRDLTYMFQRDAGTFYPYSIAEHQLLVDGTRSSYVNYASGLWVGGRVGDETRVIIAEYSDEYVPGPMQDSTFMPDNPDFHVYKLYSDSLAGNPNSDYLNWPTDQGAPVNSDLTPMMLGDQMLWAVYNDADPDQHGNDAGETEPLGLEVRQTTFAWDDDAVLSNVIFLRWRVYNRGPNDIEDCFLSIWVDPDLGGHNDDLVGCDTMLDLGYCYNATNSDAQFGATPPCLGFDFLQGPSTYTGDPADTARMWGQLWPGFVNMGMVSFNKYINGTDPDDFMEVYYFMQGLNAAGEPYVYNGDTLAYMHSGNPVAGTGDLDFDSDDRRMMLTTGPITMSPGDSTEIIAAMVIGTGADRLQSITVMKQNDQAAQALYELGFDTGPDSALINATDPDTMLIVWTGSIDPIPATATIGWDENGFQGLGIDAASVSIAEIPVPDSARTQSSHPGFVGPVTVIYFAAQDFLDGLGAIYGVTPVPIQISGNFVTGDSFALTGHILVGGHIIGDFNRDQEIDITDLVFLVQYMFHGGPEPYLLRLADIDGSGVQDISDLVYLVNYMFHGGPSPVYD